jgi:hypothetical protein
MQTFKNYAGKGFPIREKTLPPKFFSFIYQENLETAAKRSQPMADWLLSHCGSVTEAPSTGPVCWFIAVTLN